MIEAISIDLDQREIWSKKTKENISAERSAEQCPVGVDEGNEDNLKYSSIDPKDSVWSLSVGIWLLQTRPLASLSINLSYPIFSTHLPENVNANIQWTGMIITQFFLISKP